MVKRLPLQARELDIISRELGVTTVTLRDKLAMDEVSVDTAMRLVTHWGKGANNSGGNVYAILKDVMFNTGKVDHSATMGWLDYVFALEDNEGDIEIFSDAAKYPVFRVVLRDLIGDVKHETSFNMAEGEASLRKALEELPW